jgi:hypothetical protein
LAGAGFAAAFFAATLAGTAFLATGLATVLAAGLTGVFTTTDFFTGLADFFESTGFLEAVFLDLALTVGLLAAPNGTGVLLGSGARDCSHKPQGFIKFAKTAIFHQTKD